MCLHVSTCCHEILHRWKLYRSQRYVQRYRWLHPINNAKRNVLHSILERTVQREFALCKARAPLLLRARAITTQHLLNRTVEPLCQTICLRVVGCGKSHPTTQQNKQLIPKLRSKTHISIRNNLFWHTILTYPVFKKEISYIQCSYSGAAWNAAANSRKTVNDTKNSIMATCATWQGHYEVHGHMLKRHRRILNWL